MGEDFCLKADFCRENLYKLQDVDVMDVGGTDWLLKFLQTANKFTKFTKNFSCEINPRPCTIIAAFS